MSVKAIIQRFLQEEQELIRLQMVIKSGDYGKALEYCGSSRWTVQQLCDFVQLTGELPPDDLKGYPKETLELLAFALNFGDPQ